MSGNWQGYWLRAGDTLRVTLHVQPDSLPGRYKATFDSDRLRVSGIPFTDVKVLKGPGWLSAKDVPKSFSRLLLQHNLESD